MHASQLLDWRIAKAAEVDTSTAPLGSPGPRPGDIVVLTSVTEAAGLGQVSFATPSPPSLALQASIIAASRAAALRPKLRFQAIPGSAKLEAKHLGRLFDFFEQCMIAVTFAYQALESYSNQIIADHLKEGFELKRRKKRKRFSTSELERVASTEEKLGIMLPKILGLSTPKGGKQWERMVMLKRVRDSTIHLKSKDYYIRGRPDTESLFHRFLNADPYTFPQDSIALIRYFAGAGAPWLDPAQELLDRSKRFNGTRLNPFRRVVAILAQKAHVWAMNDRINVS